MKAYRVDLRQYFEFVACVESGKETIILPCTIPREEIERILNYMYTCLDEADKSVYKFWLRDIAVVETFFATWVRVY